jgi:hypothetical protein
MASPFQRYQSGIEASTGNLVPASGQMAAQTANAMAGFGQNLAQGLQQYNENSAKNDILTSEAEALGQQIQQYAQMFGDSPEHKPFADSLQPYIQQLAKVPSMSLTQKMGAVTGVKAGFANIGQQLQVFELMRGERMKRDMNNAGLGVKEYDEQTVPTAIIPSGKMPYFYNKSYAENEAEIVRLTNDAKAKGANVDIPTVLNNWRSGLKANAMSRTDIPPQVKERLLAQIDAGQNLTDNIQTDESGVTDYANEAEMYDRTSTSVKDQLVPPKTTAKPVTKVDKTPALRQKAYELERDIAKLSAGTKKTETVSDSEFNSLVESSGAPSRWTGVSELQRQGWKSGKDAKGNQVWSRDVLDEKASKEVEKKRSELSAIRQQENQISLDRIAKAKTPQGELEALQERRRVLELTKNDDTRIEGSVIPTAAGWASRAISDAMQNQPAFQALARSRKMVTGEQISPEVARELVEEFSSLKHLGIPLVGGSIKALFDTVVNLGGAENLTKRDKENIARAINDYKSKVNSGSEFRNTGIDKSPEREIVDIDARIERLQRNLPPQQQVATQQSAQGQQAGKGQPVAPQQDYTLTNQQSLSLGTTTTQIATSLESKRTSMKNFFVQKYGYIPASFEESFKSIYPEASFKTMETPYGAFMYDGKEWKQIQVQQPKVMSNKEIGEEKAVTFGTPTAGGNLDFAELVPRSGIYVRGIYAGSPTDAGKFRTEMLETANARLAVNRLIEINDMVGESMPWNAKLWGEAKALLPQIKAGLRTDIIGVGTVSNYEQQLIEDVVADPTKFWSLESSDRAKLAEIMRRVNNRLTDKPAMFGLEVRVAGQSNAEVERSLRLGNSGKSKLELDFEAKGNKKGVKLNWDLSNKIPDALKD